MMVVTKQLRKRISSDERVGFSRTELLVLIAVIGGLITILLPKLLSLRETSRRAHCQSNMKQIVMAMHVYHETHKMLPPAAIWSAEKTVSLALHESKQIATITRGNWFSYLLDELGEQQLSLKHEQNEPIGSVSNEEYRTTPIPLQTCPSDLFNFEKNHFELKSSGQAPPIKFARGNYAINGGSQNSQLVPPTTAAARGEVSIVLMEESPRRFQMWGNGIAGINKSFSYHDFPNGLTTLVALDELRAGIHPSDPRGVWALGQIGSSISWAHGVQGDASQPNATSYRSDDLLGCGELHQLVGSVQLEELGMPCCHYVDRNAQAAARSQHPAGVNVALMDGSSRFISNNVDPGVWHVMHSRQTPQHVLQDSFDEFLATVNFDGEAAIPLSPSRPLIDVDQRMITNSIGLTFVKIPAGQFTMGVPDSGNSFEPPAEVPAHEVHLSRSFFMGSHEVTIDQYQTVMNSISHKTTDPGELPVVNVSWEEAAEFCVRLTELRDEKTACRVYRLPTEAEWEYCCRSGHSSPYAWHGVRQPGDDSGEAAGIQPVLSLRPVGTFRPNEFGLFDMRGNAWEWCSDWFDRDYYARSTTVDPQGPTHGFLKVVRGGDWRFIGEPCRHDYAMLSPWLRNQVVGFRVVCEFRTSD